MIQRSAYQTYIASYPPSRPLRIGNAALRKARKKRHRPLLLSHVVVGNKTNAFLLNRRKTSKRFTQADWMSRCHTCAAFLLQRQLILVRDELHCELESLARSGLHFLLRRKTVASMFQTHSRCRRQQGDY